jgi:hypothetical protein
MAAISLEAVTRTMVRMLKIAHDDEGPKCRIASPQSRGSIWHSSTTTRRSTRRPPAEADMQFYLRVTPPSVHQMVLTLAAKGFIARTPGQPRSIRLLIRPEDLPALD